MSDWMQAPQAWDTVTIEGEWSVSDHHAAAKDLFGGYFESYDMTVSAAVTIEKTLSRYTGPVGRCTWDTETIPEDMADDEFLLLAHCCCPWRWYLLTKPDIVIGTGSWSISATYDSDHPTWPGPGDQWDCIPDEYAGTESDTTGTWSRTMDILGTLNGFACACGKDNIGGEPTAWNPGGGSSSFPCFEDQGYYDEELEEYIEVWVYTGPENGAYLALGLSNLNPPAPAYVQCTYTGGVIAARLGFAGDGFAITSYSTTGADAELPITVSHAQMFDSVGASPEYDQPDDEEEIVAVSLFAS